MFLIANFRFAFRAAPYGAQLPLRRLGPGRYLLSGKVTDNVAKTNATQTVKFVVE